KRSSEGVGGRPQSAFVLRRGQEVGGDPAWPIAGRAVAWSRNEGSPRGVGGTDRLPGKASGHDALRRMAGAGLGDSQRSGGGNGAALGRRAIRLLGNALAWRE